MRCCYLRNVVCQCPFVRDNFRSFYAASCTTLHRRGGSASSARRVRLVRLEAEWDFRDRAASDRGGLCADSRCAKEVGGSASFRHGAAGTERERRSRAGLWAAASGCVVLMRVARSVEAWAFLPSKEFLPEAFRTKHGVTHQIIRAAIVDAALARGHGTKPSLLPSLQCKQ